jgi:hypothetical protein
MMGRGSRWTDAVWAPLGEYLGDVVIRRCSVEQRDCELTVDAAGFDDATDRCREAIGAPSSNVSGGEDPRERGPSPVSLGVQGRMVSFDETGLDRM